MRTTIPETTSARSLSQEEIQALETNWCRAESWDRVKVCEPFEPSRFKDVYFGGDVLLGSQEGVIEVDRDVTFPTGVYEAALIDCRIGANVLIRRVGGHLSRYDIGAGAVVQNVGAASASRDATFGNGVEVEVANEGGGREIILCDELTSQLAYALAFFRHRPALVEQLQHMIREYAGALKGGRGVIGDQAVVRNVGELIDVRVGPHAHISGALRLVNGTILSEEGAPTLVGAGVEAEDFVLAEGAKVESGAILSKTFVGQATKMGRGFSAENSIFFCNCEAFHGEAVALFAGPYTVTHHKGSLLIAGLLSFYNAGSATNMSNHMYKLGPVHQGIIERGSKTGSGSYLLWPSRIGAFSVVLGKNFGWFDASDFPFSYISGESDGKSYIVPGMNLFTVGTKRDGAKWPKRDRRTATDPRDLLTFDVFSPYTVSAMLRGEDRLLQLSKETDKSVENVTLGGLTIKRLLLRVGAKNYRTAIDRSLAMALLQRIESLRAEQSSATANDLKDGLQPGAVSDAESWMDFGGLLARSAAVAQLCDDIEKKQVASVADFRKACEGMAAEYDEAAWAFVAGACRKRWGKAPADLTTAELADKLDALGKDAQKFTRQVLGDAEKEYDEMAKTGYGVGWADAGVQQGDFEAVRGSYESDSFVRSEQEELDDLQKRIEQTKAWLGGPPEGS